MKPGAGGRVRALALQGGGCRTFFQLGLLATAGEALGPFDQVAAVSASAAMACAHALGIHDEAFQRFAGRVRGNRANFYPARLLAGRRPTPHLEMFRETLRECLTPARFAALQQGRPRLRLLIGLGPRSRWWTTLAAAATFAARRPLGLFAPHVVEVERLAHAEELVEAILHSSAFPPFTPLPVIAGRVAVDGGAVEAVPLGLCPPGAEVTAILTRPASARPLPPVARVLAPRAPLSVRMWDYADERALVATYDAGRQLGDEIRRRAGG